MVFKYWMAVRAELESVYPYAYQTAISGTLPPCTYNKESTTSVAVSNYVSVKESDVG